MSKTGVVGAGTMGNGIAHVFAQTGHDVVLIDAEASALERALATIGKNLDRLVKKEKMSENDAYAKLWVKDRHSMASFISKPLCPDWWSPFQWSTDSKLPREMC